VGLAAAQDCLPALKILIKKEQEEGEISSVGIFHELNLGAVAPSLFAPIL
jgi:hypothetical protein